VDETGAADSAPGKKSLQQELQEKLSHASPDALRKALEALNKD
jgi:hypothetical protein